MDQHVSSQPVGVRQLRLIVEADEFDEALAFYRDVLGLEEQAAFSGDGDARVAILRAGEATLEVANTAQREMIDSIEVGRPAGGGIRVAFEVDDTAATVDRLRSAGATHLGGPVETPWRSLNARLAGPAGVQLTIFQELETLATRSTRDGFGTQPTAGPEAPTPTDDRPHDPRLLLCVLLWARPGRRRALSAYEDDVLALLGDHKGRLLLREVLDGPTDGPAEMQLLEFESDDDHQSFLSDPRRTALAEAREVAVERTMAVPVRR